MLELESLDGVWDGVWFEQTHPVALRDERTAHVPASQTGGADCARALPIKPLAHRQRLARMSDLRI